MKSFHRLNRSGQENAKVVDEREIDIDLHMDVSHLRQSTTSTA